MLYKVEFNVLFWGRREGTTVKNVWCFAEDPSSIRSTQVGCLTAACNPRSKKIRHLWSLCETVITCTQFSCFCNWDKNIKTYFHIWNELRKYQVSMWDFHIHLYFPALFSISLLALSLWQLPSRPYYFFFQIVLVPLHPCLEVLVSRLMGPFWIIQSLPTIIIFWIHVFTSERLGYFIGMYFFLNLSYFE